MPSRKRNKGQARKAKAAAAAASPKVAILHVLRGVNGCAHGSPASFPPEHAVCAEFIEAFFGGCAGARDASRCLEGLEAAHKRYSSALDNKIRVQMMIDYFLGLGAGFMFEGTFDQWINACVISCAVLVLEAYEPSGRLLLNMGKTV